MKMHIRVVISITSIDDVRANNCQLLINIAETIIENMALILISMQICTQNSFNIFLLFVRILAFIDAGSQSTEILGTLFLGRILQKGNGCGASQNDSFF